MTPFSKGHGDSRWVLSFWPLFGNMSQGPRCLPLSFAVVVFAAPRVFCARKREKTTAGGALEIPVLHRGPHRGGAAATRSR